MLYSTDFRQLPFIFKCQSSRPILTFPSLDKNRHNIVLITTKYDNCKVGDFFLIERTGINSKHLWMMSSACKQRGRLLISKSTNFSILYGLLKFFILYVKSCIDHWPVFRVKS